MVNSNDGTCRTELDNHADTCVVGNNVLILTDYDRPVNVSGYDESKGTMHRSCPTVSAAVAYDCPYTGEMVIFIIHQAVYIKRMWNNLLCPMQMWLNDVRLSECPKFLTDRAHLTDDHHSLVVTNDNDDTIRIPFELHGVTSFFYTRKPTHEEFSAADRVFHLTADEPRWNPHSKSFSRQGRRMLDKRGLLHDPPMPLGAGGPVSVASVHAIDLDAPSGGLVDELGDGHARFDSVLEMNVAVVKSNQSGGAIKANVLAKRWGCGVDQAARTLRVTTQRGVRSVLHPTLSRRYATNDRMLRYRRLGTTMFSDTMFSETKSLDGHKCAQVFAARNGWTRAYPMNNKSEAHEALSLLFQREGVPHELIVDGALEQIKGRFQRKAREAGCYMKQLEPYTPWANAAESAIRELKRGAGRKMLKEQVPKRLWDYALQYEAHVRSLTCHDHFELNGQVPETVVLGETADISLFCEFGFYDWVYFRDTSQPFPEDKEVLGRYLGPAQDVSPARAAVIIKENGQRVIRSTFRRLTPDEVASPTEESKRRTFDKNLRDKIGSITIESDLVCLGVETPTYQAYDDDDDDDGGVGETPDIDNATPEEGDMYLGAEVTLPQGDKMVAGKVRRRKRNSSGELFGRSHRNPMHDTRIYEVEFPDGEVSEYAANTIAENMFMQCDASGNQYLLLDEIIDYRKDADAVAMADQYVVIRSRQYPRKTSKGWRLCVQWKDGSTSWERLAGLKESFPVQIAEYAVAQGIDHEPAFSWWVRPYLKKRDRIIKAVSSRYQKARFKFGIEVPNTVEEAYHLDEKNGNDYWRKAIEKGNEEYPSWFQIPSG